MVAALLKTQPESEVRRFATLSFAHDSGDDGPSYSVRSSVPGLDDERERKCASVRDGYVVEAERGRERERICECRERCLSFYIFAVDLCVTSRHVRWSGLARSPAAAGKG